MSLKETLARGAGAAVAVQVASFRTDQPLVVLVALLLLALLVVDTLRPVLPAHR